MRRALCYLFIGLWYPFVLSAQSVVITGRVTDAETRLVIPDAIVKALRVDSTHAMLTYALTDADGRYRLALKASSDCDLEFSVMGYRTSARASKRNQPPSTVPSRPRPSD